MSRRCAAQRKEHVNCVFFSLAGDLPLLVGVLSMFCGWARDCRFASVVETT